MIKKQEETKKAEEIKSEPETKQSEVINTLLAEVAELKKRDAENEAKLKMLYDVADKGRVFNYESTRAEKKPFKVKLSVFQNGVIIGWRTMKDELIKHPTTGLTIGETQEYELLILGNDGEIKKVVANGYPAFSSARYDERIEAEVIGKKEDYEGEITFEVRLPDGKVVSLNSRFIN